MRAIQCAIRIVAVALAVGSAALPARADYSASRDFSIYNGNPNGVWGYGYSTTLGGAYVSDPIGWTPIPGIERWTPDVLGTQCPHVSKNVTPNVWPIGTVVLQPYQMHMHPGPNNEYSVLRFSPPCCGQYRYDASFIGVDWIGTTTDVHVLKNGVVIWSSAVNGYQATTGTSGVVDLECGDTLDVAVGAGYNRNYYFDTTGVEFDVTAVAVEPGGFEGFFEPIGGADATGGSFAAPLLTRQLGSAIPVKFRATNCCGEPILSGIHTLQAIRYTSATASDPAVNATSTDAATTGNQFRLTGSTWHFNLDTGFLSKGTWKLVATLSDGSQHEVWISLK